MEDEIKLKFAVSEVRQSFSQETRSVRISFKRSLPIEEYKENKEQDLTLKSYLIKHLIARDAARCVKVHPAPHSQTPREVISLTPKLSKVKMFSWGVTSFQETSLRCQGIKSESFRGVVI